MSLPETGRRASASSIDPFGDRKTKVFFNYGNYVWAMPLDAAIRQLGNEQDDTNYAFAPEADPSGNMVIGPEWRAGPNPGQCSCAQWSSQEDGRWRGLALRRAEFHLLYRGRHPSGTKSEYETEYLIGVERELTPGLVVKARYTDRRLQRVIEDIGSQSPEGSTIGSNYYGGIANPRATQTSRSTKLKSLTPQPNITLPTPPVQQPTRLQLQVAHRKTTLPNRSAVCLQMHRTSRSEARASPTFHHG